MRTSGGRSTGRLVADVLTTEILKNPARAMHQMSISSLSLLSVDQVTDVVEPFVATLTG